MFSASFAWLLTSLLTLVNLELFSLRWAEPIPPPIPEFVSDDTLNALALGVGIGAIVLALLRTIRARQFASALLLSTLSAVWGWALSQLAAFETFFTFHPLVIVGIVLALLCFSRGDCAPHFSSPAGPMSSFGLFVAITFNGLLLFAPMSSHLPSYVQDTLSFEVTLREFYFGSVHSDLSPVSMGLRYLINLLYEHPSINATALSSIVYLSIGLSFTALSVQMLLGRTWALMFLAVALTDKWILISALSSTILGHPLLSGGVLLYLCIWAAMRPRSELSPLVATILGFVLALGVVFNLYAYSAARLTWLIGIGILLIILVRRRALALNRRGILRISTCAIPSAVAVLFIWAVLFRGDSERFLGRLLISPPPAFRVADIFSYHEKLTEVHDADVPIWWGTARPETENKSLYWRRSRAEVYAKALWFLQRMGSEFLLPKSLVLLGGLGLFIGLISRSRTLSLFASVTILLALSAFATYLLAQDYGAYRRGLACELFLCVGVIVLFASLYSRQNRRILPLLLCGIFVLLKTPKQVNALLDTSLFAYTCPICQTHVDIRYLINAPLFDASRNREVRVVIEEGGVSPFYSACAKNAFNSDELRRTAPLTSILPLDGKRLVQLLPSVAKGTVLVLSCAPAGSPEVEAVRDPDIRAICDGAPRFGPIIGVVSGSVAGTKLWWSLSEVQ